MKYLMSRAVANYIYSDGAVQVKLNSHVLQLGFGNGGDGFCYTHTSFKCLDNLTEKQRKSLDNIYYPKGVYERSGLAEPDFDE